MSATVETPRYRLLAPLWDSGECQLWPEGTVISFLGSPNEHMAPLNGEAERRMTRYLGELDKLAEIKAAMENRTFMKRAGDLAEAVAQEFSFENRPRLMPRVPDEPPPVRPDLVTPAQQRRNARGRTKMVLDAELPEAPKQAEGVGRTVAILGTDYTADAASRV